MRPCIQRIGQGRFCSFLLPSDKDARHELDLLFSRWSDLLRVYVFDHLEHLQWLQEPRKKWGVCRRAERRYRRLSLSRGVSPDGICPTGRQDRASLGGQDAPSPSCASAMFLLQKMKASARHRLGTKIRRACRLPLVLVGLFPIHRFRPKVRFRS